MRAMYHLCLLFLVAATFAQSTRFLKAEAYLKNREYKHALEYYQICPARDSVALNKIAYCQMMIGDAKESEKNYREFFKSHHSLDSNSYHYAFVLKRNLHYSEAKNLYEKLLSTDPKSKHLKEQLLSCDSAAVWQSRASVYELENCTKINSEYSDVTAVPYQDGIVFSSNREELIIRKKSDVSEDPYFNLFYAKFDTSSYRLNYPAFFSSVINTAEHEIAPAFAQNDQLLFFTNCKENLSLEHNYSRKLKLYAAEKTGNVWQKPHTFIFNDSSCSYGHPFMDNSGKMFFFASDMKGGFGGVDVYVCLKIDDKWTNPINLGPTINTPGDEMYPFYHNDGTFYFCSNYHTGMGGFDLFEAHESDGEWNQVKNMGAPFNSPDDDFAIYFGPSKKYGFLSSNRNGGLGKEDIYLIRKK